MNIALMHYRVGETDGVSLEMNKWKLCLEKMGHNVYYIAGNKGNSEACIIPELSLDDSEMKKNHYNAYYSIDDYENRGELLAAIDKQAELIEEKLLEIIKKLNIDTLVPNNILSLGHHLSAALAINNIAVKNKLNLICHHHDFYWERVVFNNPTCDEVKKILEENFPPKIQKTKHCVINSIAQKKLKEKKGLDSFIVPNVFDFDQLLWMKDEYNSDLREKLNIKDNDLFFLQATRITDRKAIELAIDVISELQSVDFRKKMFGRQLYNGQMFCNDSEIFLVMPGLSGEKESATGYSEKIKRYAEDKSVKLIWCNDILQEKRCIEHGIKKYSLWDFYANCDFITYPSIQEGWGNQLLEGFFAKRPILLLEYPVYLSDIKKHGFECVSLGGKYNINDKSLAEVSHNKIIHCVEQSINLLLDKEKYYNAVDSNFNKAKVNYSLNALYNLLKQIF